MKRHFIYTMIITCGIVAHQVELNRQNLTRSNTGMGGTGELYEVMKTFPWNTLSASLPIDTLSASLPIDTLSASLPIDTLSASIPGDTLDASTNGYKFMVEGVSKSDYVAAVKEVGTTFGMNFDAIFIESCESELPTELLKEISNANVSNVYFSGPKGLKLQTLDYPLIFAAQGDASFPAAFRNQLVEIANEQANQ